MTDALALSPGELQQLLGVISHPDHVRGLGDRHLAIESVVPHARRRVRVAGRLNADDFEIGI